MKMIDDIAPAVGVAEACRVLQVPRATFYRRRARQRSGASLSPRSLPHNAMSPIERQQVLALLNCKKNADLAPRQVYAGTLDTGRYLCSVRSMYRILEENGEVRERRNQLRHPVYKKPELLAERPNEVWTWDITKLRGPAKWTYFYLYVLLDIFSRYVVGWLVATRETAQLGKQLIREACEREGIQEGQLTVHADRGPSMTAKSLALMLADLGITKSHNRPYTSNDNPFSEAQFKTTKYHRTFPGRFGCIQDSRAFCGPLFHWYNTEHFHSGIALLTPESVHRGEADQVLVARDLALARAYAAHPERFRKMPTAPRPPKAVWINPPARATDSVSAYQPSDVSLVEPCSPAQ